MDSSLILPVSRGAAAAGASTAESPEAATVSSTAITTPAPETASEEHAQQESNRAGGSKAGEQKEDHQKHRAADEQFAEAYLPGLASGRAAAGRGLQIDSGIGGDDLRDLYDGGGYGGVVIPCLQLRNDGAPDDADLAVGENAFEAVAGLNAASAVLNGEQQDDAAISSLGADLPLVFERGGEVFDWLAVERLYRDHGNLRVGLAIDLKAKGIQVLDGLRRKNTGEITDVVGGLGKVLNALGPEEGRGGE